MSAGRAAFSNPLWVGGGLIVNIEKLTTSLQFLGAALALPAGAAGVYSAYHTYFSPAVACQEMRNATLTTLEKHIPVEAKRALLRTEVGQFESKCGEVEPETVVVFQVALQDLDKPPSRGQKPGASGAPGAAAQPTKPQAVALVAPTAAVPAAPAPAAASLPVPPARAAASAMASLSAAGPALAAAGSTPASGAAMKANPAPAGAPPRPNAVSHAAHGWVAIEVRKPGKGTEAFFSGYPADGQSLPAAGTLLTAVAFRPIWSEPQGAGPIDPTKLQGRLRAGECVRVLGTAASLGRQWAEVEPAACP